jgi:hypothetical protein
MKKTSVSEHIPSAQHLRPEAESAMPPEARTACIGASLCASQGHAFVEA